MAILSDIFKAVCGRPAALIRTTLREIGEYVGGIMGNERAGENVGRIIGDTLTGQNWGAIERGVRAAADYIDIQPVTMAVNGGIYLAHAAINVATLNPRGAVETLLHPERFVTELKDTTDTIRTTLNNVGVGHVLSTGINLAVAGAELATGDLHDATASLMEVETIGTHINAYKSELEQTGGWQNRTIGTALAELTGENDARVAGRLLYGNAQQGVDTKNQIELAAKTWANESMDSLKTAFNQSTGLTAIPVSADIRADNGAALPDKAVGIQPDPVAPGQLQNTENIQPAVLIQQVKPQLGMPASAV